MRKKPKKKSNRRKPLNRKFVIPIYDVTLWINLSDDCAKARKKLDKELGEYDGQKVSGLCTWNRWRFGLFFQFNDLDLKIIAHEVFHVTHRILEWLNTNFDKDHHEHAAILHEYLLDLTLKTLKLKLVKA